MKENIGRGEILEPLELNNLLTEFLETKGIVSISAPLLDYHIVNKEIEILQVRYTGKEFVYHLSQSSKIHAFTEKICKERKENAIEMKGKIESWVRDAFIRSGICKHRNLDRTMKFIKNYDDIILAPDTNILLDCIITSILLPEIEQRIDEDIKGCPNWILIAIPKLVMHEIERKAIRKYKYKEFPERAGWPTYEGRIGQRSLQEILDLDTNVDYQGVSVMTVGDIPPTYDSFKNDPPRWDSEIRYQIKDFISRISFHKGIFFLTQDRVNAMMARAEGLQSLYLQKPEYEELVAAKPRNRNIARVLYELLVAFGEIKINGLGKFSIFWPEKHVIDWEKSRVIISEVNGKR